MFIIIYLCIIISTCIGDLSAHVRLGLIYLHGDAAAGVPKDVKRALTLIRAAAAKDHPRAQNILG